MLKVIQIPSSTDSRLEMFQSQKDNDRKRLGEIIVDSPKVVLRMIAAKRFPKALLATNEFIADHHELLSTIEGLVAYSGPKKVLESIVGHRLHHGVIAIASRPENCPLESLGERVLVLDGLNKAENVGTMIRSADAFGIDSILIGETGLSPFARRCIRVSMGSVFRVKVRHSDSLLADLIDLKQRGFKVLGSDIEPTSLDISSYSFTGSTAMIIGNEGFGMRQETKECCDNTLRIPIRDSVDSLNAAVAAGVFLFKMSPLHQ